MRVIKWTINVLLGFGSFLALNENFEALYLNFIGIACFALLVTLNPVADAVEQTSNHDTEE